MNSAMSEKRSMTESQKPPNLLIRPVSWATLPSMKSKMLATIMMNAGGHELAARQVHGGPAY